MDGNQQVWLTTSISVTLKNGKTMSIDREGTTTSPNGVYILEDGSEILVAAGRVRVDEPIIFVLRDNKQEVALTNDGVCAVDDANDDELEQALVNQYMPMSQYDFYGYGYGVPMGALHKENTDDETWLQRCQELADERRKKHAKNCEELNKSAE